MVKHNSGVKGVYEACNGFLDGVFTRNLKRRKKEKKKKDRDRRVGHTEEPHGCMVYVIAYDSSGLTVQPDCGYYYYY